MSRLRITLRRSVISRPQDQKDTALALGFRKMHQTVERPDTPDVRGMVNKIRHLVAVEEVAEPAPARKAKTRKQSGE